MSRSRATRSGPAHDHGRRTRARSRIRSRSPRLPRAPLGHAQAAVRGGQARHVALPGHRGAAVRRALLRLRRVARQPPGDVQVRQPVPRHGARGNEHGHPDPEQPDDGHGRHHGPTGPTDHSDRHARAHAVRGSGLHGHQVLRVHAQVPRGLVPGPEVLRAARHRLAHLGGLSGAALRGVRAGRGRADHRVRDDHRRAAGARADDRPGAG